MTSPVIGSSSRMRSTSSPNNSMRMHVLLVAGQDLDDVAPDAELAAREADVVALVLDVDEPEEHVVAVATVAVLERDHHPARSPRASRGRRCTRRWRR